MVRSQKMNESVIGNRGSKSNKGGNALFVKEQRVDDSWCGNNFPPLIYTLVGFERNYRAKIPSNQINLTRNYSQLLSKLTLNP
jgi:hypothetical protein